LEVPNIISSTYNTAYDAQALFPLVDITTDTDLLVDPGERVLNLDFLDEGFQEILNNIRSWTTVVYSGGKWTTLCYQQQGTTSAWLLNLAFNGLGAPWQLQLGMVLRFPLLSEIQRVQSSQAANETITPIVSIGAPSVVGAITLPVPASGITFNGLQALYPGDLTVSNNIIMVSGGFPTSQPSLDGIPWDNNGVLNLSSVGVSGLTPDWLIGLPNTLPQVANLVWLNGLVFQVSPAIPPASTP
jgi:hypothetical protein